MRLEPLLLACLAGLTACAHTDVRTFPLAAPVLRDQDLDSVTLACDGAPKCAPKLRVNYLVWDAVDNSVFRPVSRVLGVKRGGPSADVNALDEVPDSSFFVNRLGVRTMSADEVWRGTCAQGPLPNPEDADGAWLVDHGKDDGQSPGFRVKIGDTKYMFKIDDGQGEHSSAATAIATRLYYAAGFWVPCDSVVYFRRSLLRVAPGLSVQGNTGSRRRFDDRALDQELENAQRRGPSLRAAASRWLPGVPIGPVAYLGTRDDDPNDVIDHERRRALRGSRLMAAWVAHFDSREQNTMATWLPDDPQRPGRGHVRHWLIDMGDSFGLRWFDDGFSRRLNHAYFFDPGYLGEDFVTLGIPQRAWDSVRIRPGLEDFGYFDGEHFDPEMWRAEYPMPPFSQMTEADGAWMARIIARFTPLHIEAAVRAGELSDPSHRSFLVEALIARQHAILRRYFGKLSPLTDVAWEGDSLCAVDLARRTSTYAAFRYSASVRRGRGAAQSSPVAVLPLGKVCVPVPSQALDARVPADAEARYVVVRLENGTRSGPLLLHLYDLGPRLGLQLVGIERPD